VRYGAEVIILEPMAHRNYPTWQRRHEAVLQYMLRCPSAHYREISQATGYSESHLSRITNAPEFRRRHRDHLHTAADKAVLRMLSGGRQNV